MNNKHIEVYTSTNTAGETISVPAGSSLWTNEFAFIDVIINVRTLTGTTPSLTVSVQERFPSGAAPQSVFIETAKSGSITATGTYALTHWGTNTTQPAAAIYASPGNEQNVLLGRGGEKRLVLTTAGTVTAIAVDIIIIAYKL